MVEFFTGIGNNIIALIVVALAVAGGIIGLSLVVGAKNKSQDYAETARVTVNVIVGAAIAGLSVAGGLWAIGQFIGDDLADEATPSALSVVSDTTDA